MHALELSWTMTTRMLQMLSFDALNPVGQSLDLGPAMWRPRVNHVALLRLTQTYRYKYTLAPWTE